jgi:hypothetical protein
MSENLTVERSYGADEYLLLIDKHGLITVPEGVTATFKWRSGTWVDFTLNHLDGRNMSGRLDIASLDRADP